MEFCIECKKPRERYAGKYCSNCCQSDHQYRQYVFVWQRGEKSGNRGVKAKNILRHLLRFLINAEKIIAIKILN